MGCCQSSSGKTAHAVPFGYVPYTLSLPSAMGPLWDFPIEWWFYAGWATDERKTKKFTILAQTLRAENIYSILYGIGSDDGTFVTSMASPLCGNLPSPTDQRWSMTVPKTKRNGKPWMSCKLTSGVLGLRGATYQLDMSDPSTDPTKNVKLSLKLCDNVGLVFEMASGVVPALSSKGESSCEFAMPSLAIQEGSSITLAGETTELADGNIWLDRQTLNEPLPDLLKPLYVGNWLGVVMNDHTCYSFAFFWPKENPQWIVGSELQPPVNPLAKTGIEYPSLRNWDKTSPVVGVNVLGQDDFDLNILEPNDPSSSPHWTSTNPKSRQTYCSAWRLTIRDQTYTMRALNPKSEVSEGRYFFEGAASVYDGDEIKGYAFVEQMGYN